MRDVETTFPKGKVIENRYIVEELLGTGGFGAVYRVRDKRVKGNIFALKEVVDPNRYERNRFASECKILQRLDHHGLPRVYRVFEDSGRHRVYMLMDYVDGPNLEQLRLRQKEKRFPLSQAMKIMEPIIEAVSYLHAQIPPIIHRDIKPANIIVPTAGEKSVLVDFGIAKEYDEESTTTAVRHCSPGYGAPEHYARGTNTRTDIYSLGATFYTLLTGEVPTDALHRMARLSSKGVDPLTPVNELVPTIPSEVADVLKRAMAINSHDRFATVEEFWQALQACPVEETDEPVIEQEAILREPAAAPGPSTSPLPPVSPAALTSLYKQTQTVRIAKGHVFVFCLIVLVALLTGMAFGTGILSGASVSHKPASTAAAGTASTVTRETPASSPAVTVTPTAELSPTPPAKSTVLPSPTATPIVYPVLAGRYDGTINNEYTTPSTRTSMSLSQIRQSGANISGYFAVGPGLVGNGDFTGTVTTDRKIRFLVPSYAGLPPLYFEGQIQTDGGISGTYCSYLNNQCNYQAGGYGTWQVRP